MYERSAIVLERYFNHILGYSSENNLKVNFDNYSSLVDGLDQFQNCYLQEQATMQEFDAIQENIKTIQKSQERLYKRSVKLEFNRNILFNNIEESIEEIEKCIIKIEHDIAKNRESQENLREEFISNVQDYKEKNKLLKKIRKERKEAEKYYKEQLEIAKTNVENMNEFTLEFARNFNGEEVKQKIYDLMMNNGKGEKIPFDEEVINCAVDLGLDIAQREVQCYVEIYDNILRIFDEIEKNEVKLDKFKKRLKNIRVKLNFLTAEKEYLVQFLDYERVTIVIGKKAHQKLMEEACENFKKDIQQINNLYELILKEIAYKSSKKAYRELYNKSYLIDIQEKEKTFEEEKTKIDFGTLFNSNYWRIETIKNIYTVFYNDVSEVFSRDLEEFDIPKEEEEVKEEKVIAETNIQKADVLEDELPSLLSEDTVIAEEEEKLPESIFAMDSDDTDEEENVEFAEELAEDIPEEVPENITKAETAEKEEFDIFGEKYQHIETTIHKIVEEEENQTSESVETEETSNEMVENIKTQEEKESAPKKAKHVEEDIPYEADEQMYEVEEEEASLFGNIDTAKIETKLKNNKHAINKNKEKSSKKGILKTLIKMNAKADKKAMNN